MNIEYTFLSDIVIISTIEIKDFKHQIDKNHGKLDSTWGKIEPKRNCFEIDKHNISDITELLIFQKK